MGTDLSRASHLNATGPRYRQLTRVTWTKGLVLTLSARAFLPQGTRTQPTTRQRFWSQTPSQCPGSCRFRRQVGFIVLSWILLVQTTSRLHSTVLDPAGSDDPDQSRQETRIRDSLKDALKDPAVVQVLKDAITSSLRGEIRSLREALERKEEKVGELRTAASTGLSSTLVGTTFGSAASLKAPAL